MDALKFAIDEGKAADAEKEVTLSRLPGFLVVANTVHALACESEQKSKTLLGAAICNSDGSGALPPPLQQLIVSYLVYDHATYAGWRENQLVDALDQEGRVIEAVVKEVWHVIKPDPLTEIDDALMLPACKAGEKVTCLWLHYFGWSKQFDEWVPVPSLRVYWHNSLTRPAVDGADMTTTERMQTREMQLLSQAEDFATPDSETNATQCWFVHARCSVSHRFMQAVSQVSHDGNCAVGLPLDRRWLRMPRLQRWLELGAQLLPYATRRRAASQSLVAADVVAGSWASKLQRAGIWSQQL